MQINYRHTESFDLPGNDTGVLLIHGLTGSPGEMRPLGEFLQRQGYSVKGVLLPGHGKTPEDLNCTSWQEWYEEVVTGYNNLSKQCASVFAVGLSMGGVLALHLAASQKMLKGVVPICAPIFLNSKKAYLAPYLKYFIKYSQKKNTDKEKPYDSFWYDCYPTKCIASLLKMVSVIKKELPGIKIPALVIQSALDQTVVPQSGRFIYENLGTEQKELLILEKSGHIATLDRERELVFAKIDKFIKTIGGKG